MINAFYFNNSAAAAEAGKCFKIMDVSPASKTETITIYHSIDELQNDLKSKTVKNWQENYFLKHHQTLEDLKIQALSKLTDEEKKALGF